jgi:DNA repair protein RadC
MTAAQKAARANFKKAVTEAQKLRKSNPKLTQAQALKQAFAKTKKVAAVEKKAAPKKKAASKKVGDYSNRDAIYKDERGSRKLTKGNYRVTRSKDGTFANFSKIAGKIPSEFVSLSGYSYGKEIIVAGVGKLSTLKNLVPEVKLRVTRGKKSSSDIITSAKVASEIFKRFIGKNKIDTQELVAVAYLSQSNKVLGVYVHTIGSISSANVDVRLILAGALQMGAVSLVLCHNHPSGNLKPSDADKTVTKQLIKASSYHSINVLDHIIITKESYFSFAENGLI